MHIQNAIIIIGAGYMQKGYILAAKRLGICVFITDKNPQAPSAYLADHFIVLDGTDRNGLFNLAGEVNKKYRFIGIYCGSDFGLKITAEIHDFFGLPGPSVKSVDMSLDKLRSKQCWLSKGLPTPNVVRVDLSDPSYFSDLQTKLIVKPLNSCGSQGVTFVQSGNDLLAAIECARQFSESVIVEDYFEGYGIDTIGIMWEGNFIPCGVGERYFSNPPFQYPRWGLVPSKLSEDQVEEAFNLTKRACIAVGLNNCPVKADLLFNGHSFSILEVSPRFHGDVFTSKLIPTAYDVSPVEGWFKLLCGEAWDLSFCSWLQCCNGIYVWKAIFPVKAEFFPKKFEKQISDYVSTLDGAEIDDFFIDEPKLARLFEVGGTPVHRDNSSLVGFIWMRFKDRVTAEQFLDYVDSNYSDVLV